MTILRLVKFQEQLFSCIEIQYVFGDRCIELFSTFAHLDITTKVRPEESKRKCKIFASIFHTRKTLFKTISRDQTNLIFNFYFLIRRDENGPDTLTLIINMMLGPAEAI